MAYKLQTIRSGATQHPENMLDFLAVSMINESGVVDVANGHLEVTAHLTALSVIIAQGSCYLRKEDGSMVYPAELSLDDAEISVPSNASGNPRIDAVVIFQDLSETPNTTATNVTKIVIVEGSPSASPTAPLDSAISSSIGGANPFTRLANITVNSGASVVDSVEDARQRFGIAPQFESAEVGDLMMSTRMTKSGQWLIADGDTIGGVGSGADNEGEVYKNLFNYLTTDGGLTPSDTWDNGGVVAIPDTQDRFPMGAGSSYANGDTGGVDSITIANHSHSITHTHTIAHTHTLSHTHTIAHTHDTRTQGELSQGSGGHSEGFDEGDEYTVSHNHGTTYGSNSTNSGGASTSTTSAPSSASSGASSDANSGVGGGFTKSIVNKYFAINYFIKY